MIPDKLYIEISHPISDKYTEIIAFEDRWNNEAIEYIRKDTLLEWVKEIKRICKGAEPIKKAYQTVIDKIESL